MVRLFSPPTHQLILRKETLDRLAASSDVIIEAAEGGINLYYIDNNSSAIEAFWCPLK